MITVIIPSRNEPYLDKTILDVLEKSKSDIEVYVILDGYDVARIKDKRINYLSLPLEDGRCHLRQGINKVVRECKGDYIMKLDAHCLLKEGFDLQLIQDSKHNRVQVPRRLRLDAEKWQIIEDGRSPIDYELIIFDNLVFSKLIWGTSWDDLTKKRENLMIDDIIHFQGSCWFMEKSWFLERKFMDLAYTGWGQEAEEILFETRKHGGEVKVNKNTYYAHLHKDFDARKWFTLPESEYRQSHSYSYNRWIVKHKELFINLIEQFPLMPGWPKIWKKILWQN